MLEFEDKAVFRLYVGEVLLAVVGPMNHFLPIEWKLVLPCAMPFRLVLPPRIAISAAFVGPMMGINVTALRDHH